MEGGSREAEGGVGEGELLPLITMRLSGPSSSWKEAEGPRLHGKEGKVMEGEGERLEGCWVRDMDRERESVSVCERE